VSGAGHGTFDAQRFSVEASESAGTVTLTLRGELDLSTLGELEAALPELSPQDRLVLDLRPLAFMDSSGIRLVMRLDVEARSRGWTLTLVSRAGAVRRLLELCRVEDRVEVVEDLP